MTDINPELSSHVEMVVKLSFKKDTPKIEVTMKPDEESNYTPEEKATYPKIKVKLPQSSSCPVLKLW